jgi:hypothetical protein
MASRNEERWGRWARLWFPTFLVGATWTMLTVPSGGIVSALVFFTSCLLVGVGVARDGGTALPWSVVPVGAAWLTSMTGPLFDVPVECLLVGAVMAGTTPPMLARVIRQRADVSLELLSDRGLDARWGDTEEELLRSAPENALAVVVRRAEILDELVRRGRPPDR